jgi:flagellar biosynthetic protein FlhB
MRDNIDNSFVCLDFSKIELDIQFFAKDSPTGQKTEEPTAKRRGEARDDGNIPKSQDLSAAITILAVFMTIYYFSNYFKQTVMSIFSWYFSNLTIEFSHGNIMRILIKVVQDSVKLFAPIAIAGFVSTLIITIIQNKGIPVSTKKLKWKFSNLNPISGVKKFFNFTVVLELIKSLLKLLIVGYFPYQIVVESFPMILYLTQVGLDEMINVGLEITYEMSTKLCFLLIVIGIVDFKYLLWKQNEDLKMSKYDVKQEMKQQENPEIKGKIKEKQREVAQRRMMQNIPKADVVITNPTHLACALKYERNYQAPILIAKGAGFVAERIKEIAKENDIEIIENKPIARMIYKDCEINDFIPEELYDAVATILSTLKKYKNRA